MNLTTARSFVRQFARNAGDSSMYSDADVDRAIQAIADDFIFITKCTRLVSSVTLTESTAALPAFPTNFRPERLLSAYIGDYPPLDQVDHDVLRAARLANDSTDRPTLISFDSYTTGEVYPKPTATYLTLSLRWLEPFTTWTPGGTDPGTLNVPDDYLRTILMYGATSLLQHNEPEHKYAAESWQKYATFRDSMRGSGGLGTNYHVRTVRR